MSKKNSKFKSNNRKYGKRHVRRSYFNHFGHLVRVQTKKLANLSEGQLNRNLSTLNSFLSDEFIEETINGLVNEFNDVEVVTDEGKKVPSEAEKEARDAILHLAVDDTSREVLTSDEEKPFTASRFKLVTRLNLRRRLKALRNEGKAFFQSEIRSAIRATSVVSMYRSAKTSMNNFVHALGTQAERFGNKTVALYKKFETPVKVFATSLTFLFITAACNKTQPQQYTEPAQNLTETVAQVDTVPQAVSVYQVPTDSTRVKKGDLESTIRFFDRTFKSQGGYEYAKNRLTDDIMEKYFPGKTRDEVLNAYRYVRSFYPDVENAKKLKVPDECISAAEIAIALDKFFCDGNTLPDDCSALFIDQVKGTLNKYATQVNNPCDNGTVAYQKGKSGKTTAKKTPAHKKEQAVKKQEVKEVETVVETPVEAASDSIVTQAPAPEVADSVPNGFVAALSTLEIDTIVNKQVNHVESPVTLEKSNEDLYSKKSVAASKDEALGLDAKDRSVHVEKEADTQQSKGFIPAAASIEVSTLADSDIKELKGNSLNDGVVVQDNVPASDVANLHSDNRDVHVEATNNNVPADVAPAAAPVADKHVADSTDNVAPVATDSLSTPTVTKPDYSYAFRDSTIYEVIPYSDNIPVGTPTAGYVDERGGIRNTGLGEHQISLSTDFFFKVCKGKVVAYDELVSVINERTDWTAKGGIFEGLVGEEAVFALEAWGIYYPEDSDLKKFFEYALGDKAGQEIPAETAENIKAKIDLVRMNNTLEGLPYDKSRTVTASYYNECEDKLTYAGHKTSGGKKRTGGGEGLSRWFRRSGVVPVQKAFIETPSTIEIKKEYVVDTTYIQSPVVYVKSNELGDERIEKSKVIRTATVGEVQNLEPEDRNVSVETSGQATSGKKKKACNARKKEKQRAARELAAAQNRTFMVQQRYARNS